jgi:hypothetical protein
VGLHFAETYWTAAGNRVFNTSINGTQVLTGFDIFATVGAANKGYIKECTVAADSGGQIVINQVKNSHYGHFRPISKEGYSIARGAQA